MIWLPPVHVEKKASMKDLLHQDPDHSVQELKPTYKEGINLKYHFKQPHSNLKNPRKIKQPKQVQIFQTRKLKEQQKFKINNARYSFSEHNKKL